MMYTELCDVLGVVISRDYRGVVCSGGKAYRENTGHTTRPLVICLAHLEAI